jgi:Transglutaminase-like superfamily
MVRLGLRTLGWRRAQAALAIGRRKRRTLDFTGPEAGRLAARAARLVAAAARYTGGTCLARSIVLAHLLELKGIPTELRIGVRNGGQGFEAHSWVEMAGLTLNEGPDVGQRYAAFDRNFALARINWR